MLTFAPAALQAKAKVFFLAENGPTDTVGIWIGWKIFYFAHGGQGLGQSAEQHNRTLRKAPVVLWDESPCPGPHGPPWFSLCRGTVSPGLLAGRGHSAHSLVGISVLFVLFSFKTLAHHMF